ncbi:MAG: hypothetical protein JO290_06065 [Sphingomonadaceae bacterium]|nr:hypothetical protein [Sphingomonadaceae bacterium]
MPTRRSFLEAGAALAVLAPLTGVDARKRPPRDAVAAARALDREKTTPLAQVEAAIARLGRVNGLINAVAFPNFDRARVIAGSTPGPSGPLAGVPTLIKDNIEQAGLPWTSGSRVFKGRVGVTDSPAAAAIARAGLVSIGRSTLPEFALLPTTESLLTGPTRNPWDLSRSAGGSSGGSAAAVAAGVVTIAHGNDGGGSIRIPASCCGLVGLKPSRARMIGDTGRAVTDFAVQGCLSRTVRDTAAWLAAMERPDAPYPPVGLVTGPTGRRLRIGLARASALGREPDAEVAAAFDRAARRLKKHGHRLVDARPAFDGPAVAAAFATLWSVGAAARVKAAADAVGFAPMHDLVEPLTLSWGEAGARVTAADRARAVATLQLLERQYAAQFEQYDVLMTPVLASLPVPIGALSGTRSYDALAPVLERYVAYTPVENAAGACAIALPMTMHGALPVGMQFTAAAGNERRLLELAYALERDIDWHQRRPPVWARTA